MQISGLKESSTDIIHKRFRMTLDFAMAIREITQETMRSYYRGRNDASEHQWEFAERQNRLLLALLKNEEVLTKFMTYLLSDEAWACIATDFANVFEMDETEDILAPIYCSMDQEDVEFFQRAKEGEIFTDCTEMLVKSFGVKCTGATVEELRILAKGDLKKAEGW